MCEEHPLVAAGGDRMKPGDTGMPIAKDAVLSACGTYRYRLDRIWAPNFDPCVFLMLNPSTADAEKDDNTIRRCINFATDWGFGGLVVYNIFALRATDPKELLSHKDPIGPENNEYLSKIPEGIPVVAAWGTHGTLRRRYWDICQMFRGRLSCLGTTSDGHPRHPLYVKGTTPLKRYTVFEGDGSGE